MAIISCSFFFFQCLAVVSAGDVLRILLQESVSWFVASYQFGFSGAIYFLYFSPQHIVPQGIH
jgi:hypothetical protein